jgi:hypothetical protein
VDRLDGFPKHREHCGIDGVGSRQLHVVGKLIGRYALQDELTCIRVLSFVTVEWDFAQANANGKDPDYHEKQQYPTPGAGSEYKAHTYLFISVEDASSDTRG